MPEGVDRALYSSRSKMRKERSPVFGLGILGIRVDDLERAGERQTQSARDLGVSTLRARASGGNAARLSLDRRSLGRDRCRSREANRTGRPD
jgi:hypothetical protein